MKGYTFIQFVRQYTAVNMKHTPHKGYMVWNKDWRCMLWYNSGIESFEFKELYSLKDLKIDKINYAGDLLYSKIKSNLTVVLNDYKNGKY